MTPARAMIVTGASSGIGRALASRAANAGYGVLAVARRADLLADLARSLEGAAGTVEPLALDLRSPGAAERIVAAALRRFSRIDVLVNNGGAVAVGPIAEQSDDGLREQFDVHVLAPLALVRAALPALRATRGHVFFIGSGVARVPIGGLGAYPAAKAAIRNASRIARSELRADGIAVTYVDPGAVDTAFMRRVGLAGPPSMIAVSPHEVARKLMQSLATRRAVVNVAPWQTAFVALGELLPSVADYVLARAPQIAGGAPLAALPVPVAPEPAPATPTPQEAAQPEQPEPSPSPSPFEAALAPLANRMRKLNLRREFVAGLLEPDAALDADEVALRWAGMPNKNERAITRDVLAALAGAGFLEPSGEHRYRVVRASEERA
jgi:short-subunit dehydrogenase